MQMVYLKYVQNKVTNDDNILVIKGMNPYNQSPVAIFPVAFESFTARSMFDFKSSRFWWWVERRRSFNLEKNPSPTG